MSSQHETENAEQVTSAASPSREIWALYLPQFYENEENNAWWGKGFTEWTNVRSAVPLYEGHPQPYVPLHGYYDLSDPGVMKWQGELATSYGVTNFVVFHYWYEGRHLLEKPMELLLEHPEIDFPYCFCWANHSWTRAWDGKDHEVLVEQRYGGEEEWEAHLQYLLPFFHDVRYRKIDGKPVLFIYRAGSIVRGEDRIAYWNKRLREEGFDGLFVVEYINTFNHSPSLSQSQAVFEDEPNYTARFGIGMFAKGLRFLHKKTKTTDYQDFDALWRKLLRKDATYGGRLVFDSAFATWDNSPRKGRNSRVIRGTTPQKLEHNLEMLLGRKRADDSGIIVFNAWNEWGEGAMLEPTEQFGYGFLEAIRDALARYGHVAGEQA